MPLQLRFEYISFDLHCRDGRSAATKHLLSVCSLPKHPPPNHVISDLIFKHRTHSASFLLGILQPEFVKHEMEICAAFSSITTQFEQIRNKNKKKQLLSNLILIIYGLIFNGLILKHIFYSNQCKIWRSFVVVLIAGLLSNIPNSHYGDWSICYGVLFTSIKYWKQKHFMFAIDNGICKILRVYWIKKLYKPCIIEGVDVYKHYSFDLYQEMKYLIRKIDKKKDTEIDKYFHCALKKEFNSKKSKLKGIGKKMCYPNYLLQATNWTFEFNSKFGDIDGNKYIKTTLNINAKRSKCGWPTCSKEKKEFDAKNKCSGCRIIQYCSRNHQKKHWKYMHSQQCSRYYCS